MKLIFIHGGAAAGKLTVARELAGLTIDTTAMQPAEAARMIAERLL